MNLRVVKAGARGAGGCIRVQQPLPSLVSAAGGVQKPGPHRLRLLLPQSPPCLPGAAEHVAPALGSHFSPKAARQERSHRSQTWTRREQPTRYRRPADSVQYADTQALLAIGIAGVCILTSVQGDSPNPLLFDKGQIPEQPRPNLGSSSRGGLRILDHPPTQPAGQPDAFGL